ncbi:chitinase-3-like protein 1 [Scyliorhinus canicula]|uniref:chitinase-3-like protein 1 n=1 Tax=Scyliorhinus canicula TaxID=7830 RepID=UPI0018F359F3|nr:chitinase-3-like protein 1 [Scyliorhinus canicula]
MRTALRQDTGDKLFTLKKNANVSLGTKVKVPSEPQQMFIPVRPKDSEKSVTCFFFQFFHLIVFNVSNNYNLFFITLVPSYVLLCYYVKTSKRILPNIDFIPEKIDPSLCTHLVYANFRNSPNLTEWNDDDMYKRFNNLKKKNKKLKTLLGFGGWNSRPYRYVIVSATRKRRTAFINTAIHFLRRHKFDGLDLDWRFPHRERKHAKYKQYFTLLVKEFMRAFTTEALCSGKDRLLLTTAVTANNVLANLRYEISEVSQYVDFISVLSFNLRGVWDGFTGHHSPLYADSKEHLPYMHFNINFLLKYWRAQSASTEKLLVGFPTFGVSFTLQTSNTGLTAPIAGRGYPGPNMQRSGILAYYEVCPFLKNATIKYIVDQKVRYASKGNQWVGFDDRESYKTKAEWVKKNRFGGAMLWALDLDDYNGTYCNEGLFPLANTLKTVLGI